MSIIASITADLSVNGAAISTEMVSDGCRIETLLSERGNRISFFTGDLVIAHDLFPFLGRVEKKSLSQIALFEGLFVALSI